MAVTEFYSDGGYDPEDGNYDNAMNLLGCFMKGTGCPGGTSNPLISNANIVDPFTKKKATGLVEAIFYTERIKYMSLSVKPANPYDLEWCR